MQPHVFEHLRRLPQQQPRQPLQELQRMLGLDAVVNLAENGNRWGPTEAVRDQVLRALGGSPPAFSQYPQGDGLALRTAIARRRGVEPGQILLGNGSTELIGLAARAMLMDGGSGLAARHSFMAFGRATQAAGGRFIECHATATDLEAAHLLAAVQPDTRIVYLAHPNSPTGTLLERSALAQLVHALREDILLVVDQAYAEYEDPASYPSAAAHLQERGNLLVLHTFSKIHGLAGLRIGYGIASPELADLLERVRSPFNTSAPAQAAAETALADEAFEALSRSRNQAARTAFQAEAERHRCRVSGQAGNFMLMETVFPARELRRDLLRQGVLVCPLDGYGLPNHIRVAMGTPQDMAAFWKATGPILDNLGCGCS
ncbi:MAG: histidinol-phosphate transaminase [Holophaga sp.]|nr:histidinol-phosphate transaminase [Holophaga sp.]